MKKIFPLELILQYELSIMNEVKKKLEENFMFDFKDNEQCFIFYEICNDIMKISFNKCMKHIKKSALRKNMYTPVNPIRMKVIRNNVYIDVITIIHSTMLEYIF